MTPVEAARAAAWRLSSAISSSSSRAALRAEGPPPPPPPKKSSTSSLLPVGVDMICSLQDIDVAVQMYNTLSRCSWNDKIRSIVTSIGAGERNLLTCKIGAPKHGN